MIKRIIFKENKNIQMELPLEIDPSLFKIEGDFSNADNWKAKILTGNNLGSKSALKKGDFDNVGYVMISLKDNTFIPIARSDEHNTGYDALWGYYKLSTKNYSPVFSIGNNYFFPSQFKQMQIVLKKFINFGGNPNLKIRSMDGKAVELTIGEFVNYNELEDIYRDYTEVKNKLLPSGKRFYEALRKLADDFVKAGDDPSRSIIGKLGIETNKFLDLAWETFSYYLLSKKDIENLKKLVSEYAKDSDFINFENFVLGLVNDDYPMYKDAKEAGIENFNGIKNFIHEKLKESLKNSFVKKDIELIVGDIEMLINLMANEF
jgi:hypothetical protein